MSPLQDHELARRLANAAGANLLALRPTIADANALRAEGDRSSHVYLMAELARHRPDDAVLSEEGDRIGGRSGAHRVWIVDPLDGTREYGEVPREDWAVHVALVIGGAAVVGAVALPARGLTLSTGTDLPAPLPLPDRPRIIVSRTRPPAHSSALADQLKGDLIPLGSAGAKAMAVVLGEADVYAHAGGQYEWDSAAPVVVAAAAGFHVSRLDGSPLVYNQVNPWMPDLLICHPELAADVIRICHPG